MRELPQDEKVIIIDTEEYAGNFEREMVAFITGQVGECEVGRESQAIAEEELSEEDMDWFCSNVIWTSDDHGCRRPASIAATPGWSNDEKGKHTKLKPGQKPKYPAYNSVEFVVNEWPPDNIMKIIIARAKDFCQRYHPEREILTRMSCLKGISDKPLPLTAIRWVERTVTTKDIKVIHDV
jgi:hypothetical protein